MASRSYLSLLLVPFVSASCTESGDGGAMDVAATHLPTPGSPVPGAASGTLDTTASSNAVPNYGAAGSSADSAEAPGPTDNTTTDDSDSSDTAADSITATDSSEAESDGTEAADGTSDSAGGSGNSADSAGSGNAGSNSTGQSGSSSGSAGSGAASNAGGSAGAMNAGLSSFKLAVIGSSTSAGEGASSESNGWVSLLTAALEETLQVPFSSDNLSVGGYASPDLLPNSGSNGNIDDAINTEPNLIVVALAGSNDLAAGTSQATFIERMHTLRDRAMDADIPLFFVSTAPKDLSDDEQQALKDWSDAMATEFDSCWVPSSDTYSPCFIDTFDALANDSLGIDSTYSAGDGIHLNDAGHAVIFEAALAVVEVYACSQVPCL
jgi:lysophospholipase L1-like esterase